MRLPRDVDGEELAPLLRQYGYEIIRLGIPKQALAEALFGR